MSVSMNPLSSQISGIRTYRFAQPEEKKTAVSASETDEITISQEAGTANAEPPSDPFGEKLASMTKEEFNNMIRTWRDENQTPLEINQYASVDPDGSIWASAYVKAYAQEAITEREAVQSYYADAFQEAQRPTLSESMLFLASKYQSSWSDNFAKDMSADERQWAYRQLKTMLTGGSPALNDPYALASLGGVKTVEDHTQAAKEAAYKVLDGLVRQAELIEG